MVQASAGARATLAAAYLECSGSSTVLPDNVRAWANRQHDALLNDAGTALVQLVVARPGHRVTIRYVPDRTQEMAVLIIRREGDQTWTLAVEQYGLSPREAEVLT